MLLSYVAVSIPKIFNSNYSFNLTWLYIKTQIPNDTNQKQIESNITFMEANGDQTNFT